MSLLYNRLMVKKLFFIAALTVSSLFSVLLFSSYFIRWWPFELLLSGTPYVLGVVSLGLLVSVFVADKVLTQKHMQWAYLVIVSGYTIALTSLFFSLSVQPLATESKTDNPTIRFATLNTLYKNSDDHQQIANYMKEHRIDVIALQEARPGAVGDIQDRSGYKYAHSFGGETKFFGTTGIVSKLPILDVKEQSLGGGYSYIRAEIEVAKGERMAFYAMHIMPPFSFANYAIGKSQLIKMGNILQNEELPVAAAGDFNITVFSPYMRDFTSDIEKNLQPVITNRWPDCSWYAPGEMICLRIDHVFIPVESELVRSWIAPFLGSDHRMVVAEFTVPR